MSKTKEIGSPAWVKDFTALMREYGYPSLQERTVAALFADIKAGNYNSLNPIAVIINNRMRQAGVSGVIEEPEPIEETPSLGSADAAVSMVLTAPTLTRLQAKSLSPSLLKLQEKYSKGRK
jgi:hypothetical protein